jgi:predicted PurR-regulated permease PerM
MVVVTSNWRIWLAGMAASLVIFGVLFFTVIKPSSDTANQAIKSGLQQSQQAINQAQKQLGTAEQQAGSVGSQAGAVAGAVSTQAQQQLNNAAKLTACISAAGTDVAKAEACQVKFAH